MANKKGLKKNSLFGNEVVQVQDTIENFSAKIQLGKMAQRTGDFMICARIESLILEKGMDDALNRAFAYVTAGADAIMIHSRKKEAEQNNERHTAHKAPFLTKHGNGKVSMLFGQEAELALCTIKETLAEHLTRTDGNLGLDDVVAGTTRVGGRIKESHDAPALVIVQGEPAQGEHQRYDHKADTKHTPLHPMEKHHATKEHEHGQARTKIGLIGNEKEGNNTDSQYTRQALPAQGIAIAAQGFCAHHKHGKLCQLTRLEIHDAKVYPTLRTIDRLTNDRHEQKQDKHDHEAWHG